MKFLENLMSQARQNYSMPVLADILSVSKTILLKWEKTEKLRPLKKFPNGNREYALDQLMKFEQIREMQKSGLELDLKEKPLRPYSCIELFAGGGGLALGLEKAGFHKVLLNDIDSHSCES